MRPHAAGTTTAALFVALTAGQAVGAGLGGALAGALGPPGAFLVHAVVLLGAAAVRPHRATP